MYIAYKTACKKERRISRSFLKNYLVEKKHYLLLLYFPFYLWCFHYLETHPTGFVHEITCFLDYRIPFVEWFVIPYYLWFFYIGFFGICFMIKEKETFCSLMQFGIIGMTLFLLISYVYPNGLAIRPSTLEGNSFCVILLQHLYKIDTPTNVLPSIHVYNSIGIGIAVWKSRLGREKPWVKSIALFSTTIICLSTIFIKQHSVTDVGFAILLSFFSYFLIYRKQRISFNTQSS